MKGAGYAQPSRTRILHWLYSMRFRLPRQNKVLIGAAVATLVATTLVCEVPFLANAFGFTSISFVEYVIAIALGVLVIPIVETVKAVQRKAEK